MIDPALPPQTRVVHSTRGRWQIPVPRESADRLHRKLEKLGYPSTLCLSADDAQETCLELWPEVDPEKALNALLGPQRAPVHSILTSASGVN